MLEVRGLSAGYSQKEVLQNVSISIPSGKVTVILGPNGCGKSTFLKVLCGILSPVEGEIILNGESIRKLESRLLARKVAYLTQNRQVPEITVERLVLHGRFPYLNYPRRYRKEDMDAARMAMRQMEIEDLADVPLQNLSGGQRQKAYIAMILAQNTQVVLLDEPTTYLDVEHQLHMMQLARQLAVQEKMVVMVLHDLSLALQTADQVVVMETGRIAAAGTPEEIYDSGKLDHVFKVALGRVKTKTGWHYYYEEAVPLKSGD